MAQTLVSDRESVPGGWVEPEAAGAWFDPEFVTVAGGGGGGTLVVRRTLHEFGSHAGGRQTRAT